MDPELHYGGGDKSSAEGASVEAPQALRDVHGEECPLPTGGVVWEGQCLSAEFFYISMLKMYVICLSSLYFI